MLKGVVYDMLSKFDEVKIGVVEINGKAFNLYMEVGFEVTKYNYNYANFIECFVLGNGI